jgi:hypothetical protein
MKVTLCADFRNFRPIFNYPRWLSEYARILPQFLIFDKHFKKNFNHLNFQVHTYKNVYVCMYVCMCVCVYIYIYTPYNCNTILAFKYKKHSELPYLLNQYSRCFLGKSTSRIRGFKVPGNEVLYSR